MHRRYWCTVSYLQGMNEILLVGLFFVMYNQQSVDCLT